MALLEGKTGIVFGVANKRSIAWGIAQALAREGARLAFTYQGERLKESVEALTTTIPNSLLLPCDVTNDADIDAVFRGMNDVEVGGAALPRYGDQRRRHFPAVSPTRNKTAVVKLDVHRGSTPVFGIRLAVLRATVSASARAACS